MFEMTRGVNNDHFLLSISIGICEISFICIYRTVSSVVQNIS